MTQISQQSNKTKFDSNVSAKKETTELSARVYYSPFSSGYRYQGWDFYVHKSFEKNKEQMKKRLIQSTEEILEKLYDNNVIEISLPYSYEDEVCRFKRLFFENPRNPHPYHGEGIVSKMSKLLKKENRDDIVWYDCRYGVEDKRLIILMEYLDIDFIEKLRSLCTGWSRDLSISFLAHSKIQHRETKQLTAYRYCLSNYEYTVAMSLGFPRERIFTSINRHHISYDKYVGAVTEAFGNNGFRFAKDRENIPPNYDHLSNDEAFRAVCEWNRERLKIIDPKGEAERQRKEKIEDEKWEKKAQKEALKEADKKAKEEYRKANPVKDVVLNPFKQVGKDISGWFDSLYKK